MQPSKKEHLQVLGLTDNNLPAIAVIAKFPKMKRQSQMTLPFQKRKPSNRRICLSGYGVFRASRIENEPIRHLPGKS